MLLVSICVESEISNFGVRLTKLPHIEPVRFQATSFKSPVVLGFKSRDRGGHAESPPWSTRVPSCQCFIQKKSNTVQFVYTAMSTHRMADSRLCKLQPPLWKIPARYSYTLLCYLQCCHIGNGVYRLRTNVSSLHRCSSEWVYLCYDVDIDKSWLEQNGVMHHWGGEKKCTTSLNYLFISGAAAKLKPTFINEFGFCLLFNFSCRIHGMHCDCTKWNNWKILSMNSWMNGWINEQIMRMYIRKLQIYEYLTRAYIKIIYCT